MKATPIIMQGQNVLASLRGDKTQTRRLNGLKEQNKRPEIWILDDIVDRDGKFGATFRHKNWGDSFFVPCPYGQPGNLLWVRENVGSQVRRYGGGTGRFTVYQADNPDAIDYETACGRKIPVKWTPSIHMPRHLSRLTLRITEVRVQRLQEISEEDAREEGFVYEQIGEYGPGGYESTVSTKSFWRAKDAFAELWDSINAKPKPVYRRVDGRRVISHYESYPWGGEQRTETHRGLPHYIRANPWVWAISYTAIAANIDRVLMEAA